MRHAAACALAVGGLLAWCVLVRFGLISWPND